MARATITTIGFYIFGNQTPGYKPLFEDMVVPSLAWEGKPLIDKQTLIDRILFRVGEREVYYSDYDIMREAITNWSKTYLYNWTKLAESMLFEYNPIWNKDGTFREVTDRDFKWTEDETTKNTEAETTTGKHDSTDTVNTSTTKNATWSENGNDKHSVLAFNAGAFADRDQNVYSKSGENHETGSANSTDTLGETSSGSLDNTKNGTLDNDKTEKGQQVVTRVEQGNIGVTTTQQMIQAERDIVVFSLYDVIVESYCENFCLPIFF